MSLHQLPHGKNGVDKNISQGRSCLFHPNNEIIHPKLLAESQKHTQQVLAVNGRAEIQDHHRNKMFRLKKGKGNCSHRSQHLSTILHPLQITQENPSDSHCGLCQSAIKSCDAIHCPRQVTEKGESKVEERDSLGLTKSPWKLHPPLLGIKIPAMTYPKDSNIF